MATRADRPDESVGAVARPLVAIVDDDESVRESLPDLLRAFGLAATAFDSGDAFLTSKDLAWVRCLLLDVCMPGMTGLELQSKLESQGIRVPIIFITAKADVLLRERLMQGGAAACLFKPFTELQLRAALDAALR